MGILGWRGLAAAAIVLLAAANPAAGQAASDPVRDAVEEQLRLLDMSELEAVLESLNEDVRRQLPVRSLRELIFEPERGMALDPVRLAQDMLYYLIGELVVQSRLLGQLIILAVLCAVLQNLAGSLSRGAPDVGFLAAYAVVIYLGLQSFSIAAGIGRETLDAMASFMFALLPLLATMLAAVGAVSSAALFHPLLVTVVTLVVNLIDRVVFPLLFLAAVLGVAGHLIKEFSLSKLAGLFRHGAITALGLAFTLFLGVMVIRGAIAPVADGVALRASKFLAGAFIPVIGGMMADAVEVVVGGSLLVKNAVGVFGMVAMLVMVAFPMLKVLALVVIYRMATALVQPVSDPRLVEALGTMADTLTVLLASVMTAALMFFVAITVVVGVGNLAAVVR
ncbi:MAG: stage III sporulation protein AE [Firmicutes bacterium]|nr:stage III sporulation protein AE [Bacillota bacterium]